ncbi:TPA: hypothetical protein ACLQU7_004814 [Bacillus tropicus]|uniref:hypothetical protein n=1 Tax=Bacillus cereus group TaxID=86661 RepID=UPI000181CA13|nr:MULTISPECIES: hypothetical protein [Bacillus cereus group]AIY73046.1 hypothetical protein NT98_5799 [Bacillus cereus]AJI07995.1 hypothetical protein AQ16_5585 [Bacillus cereus G9241]QPS53441.1 hypothetical protein I6G54_28810 [Bacillus tropicus]
MTHLLKYSLDQKILIELIYLKGSGDFFQRTVIVKKIYEDHVVVYCIMRKQVRVLKIDRILLAAKIRYEIKYA